ncbi:MAG TPA: hypothetical protein VEG64_03445 [Candidatus Sulfotelmatobacter sp.]|nr:hypothetical protein [Candidatus Sulfotelmatobacter sp.]
MPDLPDLASFISGLADANSARREAAAAEIFRLGQDLVRDTAEKWLADSQLAAMLEAGKSGFPETTVGVAVQPEMFDRIRLAHGSPQLADVPPDQDAKEFELHLSGDVRLDVLTTKQPGGGGAIARYLQRFGEGIQQIELLARNVDEATRILREKFSLEPVYPQTRAGADGTRVNFFLVPASQGKKVLVELVEAASPQKT